MFPWRIAVGLTAIVPFLTAMILFACPESPVWLLTKENDEKALKSLEKLRGKDNKDIIEAEFKRIKMNLKIEAKEQEISNGMKIWETLKTLTGLSFLKPFSLLLLIFCVNLEWCGVAAIAFYLVTILE